MQILETLYTERAQHDRNRREWDRRFNEYAEQAGAISVDATKADPRPVMLTHAHSSAGVFRRAVAWRDYTHHCVAAPRPTVLEHDPMPRNFGLDDDEFEATIAAFCADAFARASGFARVCSAKITTAIDEINRVRDGK